MKYVKKIVLLVASFLFVTVFTFPAYANSSDNVDLLPVITVINPIRGNELGHNNEDLLPGLRAQWRATKDLHVEATWLWQYTALENDQLADFAKTNMQDQEFGLFLEIDRNFTRKANVQYRGTGPWY